MTSMRRRSRALALVALLVVAACGGSDDAAETADTVASTQAVATTKAPTTTARPTTTTELATTTLPATTTTATLPVPVAPPEPRAAEPRVELGSLEIPKLGVLRPLFEGVTLTTLDLGPGHWPGTAMPGQFGNVVVGGHRTSHDKPFRHVDQLVPGDEVIFTTPEGRFVYHVTLVEIVTPDAIWIIDQKPEYTATLFACHPVGSTRERIIVHLRLAGT